MHGINLASHNAPDPLIEGISYDSRQTEPGDLFVAVPGEHVDGHAFVDQALDRGARAVVHSQPLSAYRPGIAYRQVEDSRTALSALAAAFYEQPSQALSVIGVTGTDGKSSTVYFIHQLLRALGKESGFLSTVAMQLGESIEKNPFRQSTPEALEIHRFLADMRDSGKEFAVLEATSHGLSARTARLHDVAFHVAVFTTLSHEHIEFHGSFEQYRSDKGNLFRALDPLRRGSFAVLNADDPAMEYFSSLCKTPWYTYGVSSSAGTLTASALESDVRGSRFTLHWQGQSAEAELRLPGRFHVENVLAALVTVASLTKTSPLELVDALSSLEALPGRFERVAGDQPFSLIVDYAHTPGSFEKLFPFTRRFAPARIITVFGSAGERDVEKRSLQGSIASEYSDIIILTDEDPRDEDRMAILDDIARGVEERSSAFVRGESLLLIPDRREAIRRALEVAQQDDLVLLLGKGHEASIIYPDGPVEWNERAVAEELLREAGYTPEPAGNSAPVHREG